MKRRESMTGKMQKIGSRLRRESAKLGLFRNSRFSRKSKIHREAKDIDFIGELVHEKVKFDWEKYEKRRRASVLGVIAKPSGLFRRRNMSIYSHRTKKKKSLGAVVPELVESETENEADSDDVYTSLRRTRTEENLASKIMSQGREKLKFIMDFAKPKDEREARKKYSPVIRKTDQPGLLEKKNTFADILSAGSSSVKKRSGSRNGSVSSSVASITDTKGKEDSFARYKGFRDAKHMEKHLERLRGYAELKSETQIEIMAREGGYKPETKLRTPSILSYLNENVANEDFTKPEMLGSKTVASHDGKYSDAEFLESESDSAFSGSDLDDDEVAKFMQSDTLDIEEMVSELDVAFEKSIKKKKSKKEKSNKSKEKQKTTKADTSFKRLRPKDSLGPKNFASMNIEF